MTQHAAHIREDELILHFYGEAEGARVETHLASCPACRTEFERLRQVLSLMDHAQAFDPADMPGPAFEREVWARLEPQLTRRRSWFASWLAPRRLVLAASVATLLLVAFLAGRFSRDDVPAGTTADGGGNVAERVLVVAVVDHLDRSQMVLLEVLNADVESAGDLAAEQTLARELVAANRLYRQTAAQTGDGSTGDVLDELERTLLEIANTPADASQDDLDALRARISSRGLLFKVRVVHSEMLERERQTVVPGSQS
jgi:predicted anti-sigma-YlaC factor YlaD